MVCFYVFFFKFLLQTVVLMFLTPPPPLGIFCIFELIFNKICIFLPSRNYQMYEKKSFEYSNKGNIQVQNTNIKHSFELFETFKIGVKVSLELSIVLSNYEYAFLKNRQWNNCSKTVYNHRRQNRIKLSKACLTLGVQ